MSTAIVKKIAIIASILIAIILLSVGCNFITRERPNPNISNPDGSFITYGNITITREALYNRVKVLEGVNHLLNYVDEILLADYIDAVTQEELDKELLIIKFGTDDLEKIDEFTEAELEEIEKNYRLTLTMAGFNHEDDEEVDRFIRLAIAKRNLAIDQFIADLDANEETSFAEELKDYYEKNYRGDAIAIELIFNSATEYERVLRHHNLVPSYQGGIGLYFGETPLANVARENLNDTNTRKLEIEEVFSYYIILYNYLYPYRDALDETLVMEDLDAFTADYFNFNYNEMRKTNVASSQATYLFDTLKLDDDTALNYAIRDRQYTQASGNTGFRSMIFKLSQEELVDFDELDEETRDDIEDKFVKSLVNQNRINQTIVNLRKESGFKIHDTLLAMSYDAVSNATSTYYEENRDKTILASFDDFEVTVDDFFGYMVRRVGALHAIELYKEGDLIQGEHFEALYGSNRNFSQNNSQLMKDHRAIIQAERQNFASGAYMWYGFSPQQYTWREFLYLYYGFASDEDLVQWLVMQNLLKYLAFPNIDFERAIPYVNEQHENYFSLRVEHIVIFVDFDRDLAPDDFEEYLEGLDESGLTTYNFLKAQLETLLLQAVEDGQSLQQIVTEYNSALRGTNASDDDFSKWAMFKNYGFRLKFENLSTDNQDLNYLNTGNFVESYVENLQRIYEAYSQEENKDAATHLDDRIFTTQFGLHLVRARKGTNFVQPSAAFENENGTHDSVWENDSDIPSVQQMEAWAAREFDKLQNQGVTTIPIPESVDTALRTYFGPYHNRMYNNPQENTDFFGNLITIQTLMDANGEFSMENAHLQNRLLALKDLYEMLVFPDIKED
ncbi:MAG: hypothetical protein ACNA7U_01550 [Candidatus Izemoplasmataceae bacterium]